VFRIRWFIFSVLLGILSALPAQAGQLQSWRFDRGQNRLEFTTNEGVQPTAQLIPNPTRIVVDLPNTTLGRSLINEVIGGQVSNIRIGQFDRNTTRLVIELAPGYTVDPQQVQVQSISPRQWVIALPDIEAISSPPRNGTSGGTSSGTSQSGSTVTSPGPSTGTFTGTPTAATQITGWRETPDGLFIRTRGAQPAVDLYQTLDGRAIELDIANATIDPSLANQAVALPNLNIDRLSFSQAQANPPIARIRLDIPADSFGWQASVSNLGGIVLLPQNRPSQLQARPDTPVEPPPPTVSQVPAQVTSVTLDTQGNQLLIQTDRPLNYRGEWFGQAYRVLLTPAQLDRNVQGPQLLPNSPLSRVRLRQEDPNTVAVLLEPAPSVEVEPPQAINERLISLQLKGSRPIAVDPSGIPPTVNPPFNPGPVQLPPARQGRLLVVLDPGHGGRDPGAVGIGALYEKHIVLPISLEVAEILAQRGIQVVLTRQDDREVDLEPRVQLANQVDATIFVSIHANAISLSRPEVNGVETYYYGSNAGLQLAQTIHQSLLQNLPTRDRRVRESRFYVLRHTDMPAALVEVGFVTGAEDAPRLADPNYRSQVAAAIAQGILRYLQ
jgi:N-acetylmuramoyl-L-alanine amidase